MLTVCSKAQVLENKICLSESEIDYFINQDLTAKSLIIDTTLMGIKIQKSDSAFKLSQKNENDLKSNEKDLKQVLKNMKTICSEYKSSLVKCNEKNEKKTKWNKIYKKTIVIMTVFIVAEATVIYLMVK